MANSQIHGDPLLSIAGVEVSYGAQKVFAIPSLEIQRGVRVALFGANGSGKTTLLKVLAGLQWPSQGSIELAGSEWSPSVRGSQRSLVGYLGHDVGVFGDLTAAKFLGFVNTLHGNRSSKTEADALIDRFGLEAVLNKRIAKLSFGFKKRVALASVLLRKPEFLLLDEPFHGLDLQQVKQMAELISNLDPNISLVLSTHLVSLVEPICESYFVFNGTDLVAGKNWKEVQAYLEGGAH